MWLETVKVKSILVESEAVLPDCVEEKIMNDETRKALTEYIGECFNTNFGITDDPAPYCMNCNHSHGGRLFDCPDDAHAVFKAMVDKGRFGEFYYWAINRIVPGMNLGSSTTTRQLLDPVRLCQLAGEWRMKEGK